MPTPSPSPTPTPAPSPTEILPAGSTLEVHYIDVGQADAALVLCDGKAMLIDGGNVADSSRMVAYLKKQGVTRLDAVIATHCHEDHLGGLSGALNACGAGKVYCPETEYDSKAFRDFAKYVAAQGLSITVPTPDESFELGSATVTILGPRQAQQETNNTSIVLRIDFGATSFLFTGDAQREAEADLLNAGCNLAATVLKVGHHGSNTSTTYPFLREVMPQFAAISVGKDNSYGHPDEDTLSRLRDAVATVYRTDLQGDIIATSDGMTVTMTTAKTAQAPTNPTETDGQLSTIPPSTEGYIGNVNSHKFHLPTCGSLPAEKNRVPLESYELAIEKGFTPCKNCLGSKYR
ncbi:MAG: ComEC/Rec2 family competence protein [Oscillospiraceae bacterium]